MPCSQIRGHTNPYDFSRQGWRSALPPEMCRAAAAATTPTDEEAHHLRLPLGGRTVLCIDPGFSSRRPRRPLVPLVVDGEILCDDAPPGFQGPPSPQGSHNVAAGTAAWDWPCQLDVLGYEDESVSLTPLSWERLDVLLGARWPLHPVRPVDVQIAANPTTEPEPKIQSPEPEVRRQEERQRRSRWSCRWRRP